MSRKMISTTIYMSQEQELKLKELSKRTKVPVSVYIRDGIDMILSDNKSVFDRQVSFDFK